MNKHLLSLASFLVTLSCFAQPVISTSVVPTNGDVLKFHKAQYLAPGSAGANQTWNYSTLTSSAVKNYTVGLPSATPYATTFPNANLQMNDGTNYEFWSTTANDVSSEGVVDGLGSQPNTDPEKVFQFPGNFNGTHTDNWGGQFTLSSFSATRTATTTVTYDGYGTLTTPAGTFSNVARLHVVQSINDATGLGTVTRGNDEYRWYSNSYHGPLLTIYTRTVSISTTTTESMYQEVDPLNPVGVSEYVQANSVIVAYPNPASEVLNLYAVEDRAVTVEFYDFQGKLIYAQAVPEGSPVKIDVSAYSEGLYFVRVNTVNGKIENKKILIRR